MLEGNRKRVQRLSGAEIWAFIVARTLIGFAAGVFAMRYFPGVSMYAAWLVLILGIVLFAIAAKGMFRTGSDTGSSGRADPPTREQP